MTFEIAFVIPGAPVPKGRPRTGNGTTYTPKRTRYYEHDVRLMARAALGMVKPYDGAVHIDLVAYLPIARSWPKWKQQAARDGTLYPTKKPDLDNLEKSVTDGCNGVIYLDDAQIVEVYKAKRYSDNPHLWVRISSIEAPNE
ncbi:RusA family crossover junction endodeoxyribonuclease [Burkholderia stagnalis]|uniref:RusA family crossover junction endodeoxyribonuclease n=1 Tax=Burkholderia stagnalis TaxID=1503054 RepID=UPI000F7FFF76|nr:RusA family crossover junction endodeoxyribonuclease [Burkholderia stagnalis]